MVANDISSLNFAKAKNKNEILDQAFFFVKFLKFWAYENKQFLDRKHVIVFNMY